MFKKVFNIVKIVLPILLFLTLIVTIILTPLRAVNVSMLVYLSGCEDSTHVTLTITHANNTSDEPIENWMLAYDFCRKTTLTY